MEKGTQILDFLRTIEEVLNQLSSVGKTVPDEQVVHALVALPNNYEPLIPTILSQDDLPTFDHLTGKLMLEETRRERRSKVQDDALMILRQSHSTPRTYVAMATTTRSNRPRKTTMESRSTTRWACSKRNSQQLPPPGALG